MPWEPHDGIKLENVTASVLVVSDSLFTGDEAETSDISGPSAIEYLSNYGFESINLDYYPDEYAAIKSKIETDVSSSKIGFILLIGGTGIAPRDVTVEAVSDVIDKELPGFGEEFRKRSFEEVQEMALMSRAIAGVKNDTFIVALPGSPNAVKVGVGIIGKIIGHVLQLIRR